MSLDATTVMLALGALAAVTLLSLVFWSSMKVTFVVWSLVLLFVPVWVGVSLGPFWPAVVAVTLLAIAIHAHGLKFIHLDGVVVAFVVLTTLLQLAGEVRLAAYVTALIEWIAFYFWGRIAAERLSARFIANCLGWSGVVLAALAITEFALGLNVFVLIPGSGLSHATWSPLQERGGFVRVEGALGHSIALGAVLAILSAFVLATKWRAAAKIVALALMATATVFTLSRIGLITFALTVAVSVLVLRELGLRARLAIGSVLLVATAAVLPFLATVFDDAGDEAGGSAGYRTDLLVLLSQVELVGGDERWKELVVGDTYLGYFARSTDNALLTILLRFGFLPTAILLSVLVSAMIMSLRRGAGPAGVALIAQVPSLFAVALITQYGMLVWFITGVAATAPLVFDSRVGVAPRGEFETPHSATLARQRE